MTSVLQIVHVVVVAVARCEWRPWSEPDGLEIEILIITVDSTLIQARVRGRNKWYCLLPPIGVFHVIVVDVFFEPAL